MSTTPKYAYEKLMQEHKLELGNLPADARVGIQSIQQIEKAISMTEKQGKKVSQSVIDKIKANDKWVCREIMDYIEETNKNTGELPNKTSEVVAEIKNEAKPDEVKVEQLDKNGVAIDAELEALHKAGKKTVKLDELKASAPKAYDVVFKNYDDSGDNGIETSVFTLIETEEKEFTLTKK